MRMKIHGYPLFAIVGASCLLGANPRIALAAQEELLAKSNIVFNGTIVQHGAASFSGVPVSRNTMVVKVNNVLLKPDSIILANGDAVTLHAQDPSLLPPGTSATFYTNGWIFGTGLAVTEIGHEPLDTDPSAARAPSASSLRKQIDDAVLQARLRDAELIISGRVVAVGPVTSTSARAVPERGPITEHAPMWTEAVVKVEEGLKGTVSGGEEVVIRFPASMDVVWFNAPKFKVGQEGTFILRRDELSGEAQAVRRGAPVVAYAVPTNDDVLGIEAASRVKQLMEVANP